VLASVSHNHPAFIEILPKNHVNVIKRRYIVCLRPRKLLSYAHHRQETMASGLRKKLRIVCVLPALINLHTRRAIWSFSLNSP
jgi:hypothetical protein